MSNKPNRKKPPVRQNSPVATRRIWWQSPFVWVVALVVVAGIATVALTAGDEGPRPNDGGNETAAAQVTGEPLPPLMDPDPGVGLQVPTVVGQTLDGQRVQVGDDGVARVYGFFAHWCPHCQAELPRTAAWLTSNTLPDGVQAIAVSTAVDATADNYPPSAWFAREAWPAPVILDDDDGTLAKAFGLTGFPYWVATDEDGVVVSRMSGEISTDEFESLISTITPG